MADLNSSLESSGLSAEEIPTTTKTTTSRITSTTTTASTSGAVAQCEAMTWEGWTTGAHPCSTTGDEASTSDGLSSTSRCLSNSFHQQSDMLSDMLSSFGMHPDPSDDGFLHEAAQAESEATVSFGDHSTSKSFTYLSGIPCPGSAKREDQNLSQFVYAKSSSPWQAHDRESTKWDHGSPGVHVPWPGTAITEIFHDTAEEQHELQTTMNVNSYAHAQSTSQKLDRFSRSGNHSSTALALRDHALRDAVVSPSPSFLSTPECYGMPPESPSSTRSQQFLNFVRIAQDQRTSVIDPVDNYVNTPPRRSGKHRGCDESNASPSPSKRPHHLLHVDDHAGAFWRSNNNSNHHNSNNNGNDSNNNNDSHRSRGLYGNPPSAAMELFAIGPALNTNGKPRARRGSATDPQSVYARHRREKINERFKTLQQLVPNGAKVDIVTMLDEAVHYVQFLQLQVKLLNSDEHWIHATPNIYKGIDLTNPPTHMQGLGSSA